MTSQNMIVAKVINKSVQQSMEDNVRLLTTMRTNTECFALSQKNDKKYKKNLKNLHENAM